MKTKKQKIELGRILFVIELGRILFVIEDDLACGDNQPLLRFLIKVDRKLLNEFLEEKRDRD